MCILLLQQLADTKEIFVFAHMSTNTNSHLAMTSELQCTLWTFATFFVSHMHFPLPNY